MKSGFYTKIITLIILFNLILSPLPAFAKKHKKKSSKKPIKIENPTTRVIGGTNASVGEYPWMVYMTFNDGSDGGRYACGGSLIAKKWVLTAMHCVLSGTGDYLNTNFQLKIGNINNNQGINATVKKVYFNKKDISINNGSGRILYNGEVRDGYDYALLELNETINNLQPISLVDPRSSILEVNSLLTVIGFGLTQYPGSTTSNILLEAELPFVPFNQCQALTNGPRSQDIICAGSSTKSACHGDSGGPLMQRNPITGEINQVGIVSGSAAGDTCTIGMFTKVDSFTNNIFEITQVQPQVTVANQVLQGAPLHISWTGTPGASSYSVVIKSFGFYGDVEVYRSDNIYNKYFNIPAGTLQRGSYYLVVEARASDLTIAPIVSNNNSLSVTSNEVSITRHPANVTANEGQAAVFSVEASGGSLNYQWYKNGSIIPGETAQMLAVSNVRTADNNNLYHVIVSNESSSLESSRATLIVRAKPVINTNPASIDKLVGQTARLEVLATGNAADGTLTYQWKKNGANIDGPRAKQAFYVTPALTAADNNARFTVEVTNAAGTIISRQAVLTIISAPTITTDLANKTVRSGNSITFTIAANGGNLNYQWFKKSGTPPPLQIQNGTSASLTLSNVQFADNNSKYKVIISNEAGNKTSKEVTLTVEQAPIINKVTLTVGPTKTIIGSIPIIVNARVGQKFDLVTTATGSALTYQWFKNGASESGKTTNTYTINKIANNHNGKRFKCRVKNNLGEVFTTEVTINIAN